MDKYSQNIFPKISGSQEDNQISIFGCPHSFFGCRGHANFATLRISGFDSDLLYPQGLACTLPKHLQQQLYLSPYRVSGFDSDLVYPQGLTCTLSEHLQRQLYLSPYYVSGFDSDLVYPQGLACTLPEHLQQQLYLSPYCVSGFDSDLVYPQGLACTLPEHLQQQLVNACPGLEQAVVVKPGEWNLNKEVFCILIL